MPSPEGRVWCAPSRRGGSGVPGVPSLRVWCALSRRGGSGVPALEGMGLVCPPQEGLVCLPWRGWVWCALPRKVWCAFPRGESGVPPLEGVPSPGGKQVWCTYLLQEESGSGVPSYPNVILIIIIVILCSSCVMEIADLTVLRVLYWRPSPKS